jgi:hypothetical protein
VPIVVDARWRDFGNGAELGQAGPNHVWRDFGGAPRGGTFYPDAVADSLAGMDLNPGDADIIAELNSSISWYFGTDGSTLFGHYDFATVVLHELAHGFGFLSFATVWPTGEGFWGKYEGGNPYPTIYDTFVETGSGKAITSFANGSFGLGYALTGNNLYFDGPKTVAAAGGMRPPLYAPSGWLPGSSYVHLSEIFYSFGDPDSLMTPFLNMAEVIHDPGPIAMGILMDTGWGTPFVDPQVTVDVKANGLDGTAVLARGDLLKLSAVITTDSHVPAEYWLVAVSRRMVFSYQFPGRTWVAGTAPAVSAPLINVGPMVIYSTRRLPSGTYTFYLAVDWTPDGVVSPDTLKFDRVVVTID